MVAGSVASIRLAGDFQQAMTQLVTGAGESQKNIGMVSNAILKMGPQVGQTALSLASGMYLIESAGFHGAAGLEVLRASAEGAAVGQANMKDTANAVTTALTDYHLPASMATQVTSALVETVASGKQHMEDLALAMGRVMPTAAALGVSFQDVMGAEATMTDHGMSARLAATSLNSALLAMSAPSSTAVKSLASVGLTAQQVKDTLTSQGLPAALNLITTAVGQTFPAGSVQYVTALKAIMGGTAGYRTLLQLTGASASQFQGNVDNIGKSLNTHTKDVQGFSKASGDLKFQIDQVEALVEEWAIKIGQFLIPMLESAGSYLLKHKAIIEALAIAIGITLVTAIGAFTVSLFAADGALAFLLTPVAAVIAGIMAFVVAIVMLYTHWNDVWNWMKSNPAIAVIIALLGTVLTGGILPLVVGAVWLAKNWDAVWSAVSGAVQDAWSFIQPILSAIGQLFTDQLKIIMDIIHGNWSQAWTDFKTYVVDAFTALWSAVKAIGAQLLSWIAQLPGVIVSYLEALPGRLYTLGTMAFTYFFNANRAVAGALLSWLSGLPAAIIGALADLGGMLLNLGAQAMSLWFNAMVNGASTVLSWAAGVPSQIINAISSLPGLLLNAGVTALTGLYNGAVQGFSNVASFAETIGGRIIGAIGDLGSILFNAGVQVVTGLLNGLKSAWGGVESFAKSAVSTLKNIFTSGLSILSPSRVFVGIGTNVMAGLSIGLAQGFTGVQSQMKGYAGQLGVGGFGAPGGLSATGAAGVATAMPSGGQSGGGRAIINIYVSGITDVDQLASEINRKIAWATKTGG